MIFLDNDVGDDDDEIDGRPQGNSLFFFFFSNLNYDVFGNRWWRMVRSTSTC